MSLFAVIKTGGKQYLVSEGSELYVDRINKEKGKKIKFETLAIFTKDGEKVLVGKPNLEEKVTGEIVDHLKGEKIRVARFKAKVRYRRVKGFRHQLTKIKILKVND